VVINKDDMSDYLDNTLEAINATKERDGGEVVGLPIDIQGHNKDDAAGWIVGAELEGNTIRLIPKWTEIGLDAIEKGIRRFFSATIDTKNKVILGGTLTNWPATRDKKGNILLSPIELSSGIYKIEPEDKGLLDKIADTLNELKEAVLGDRELASFDDSSWDAGAVRKALDVADLRKVCLLDLNGYPGQDKPVKALCHLPVRKSPGAQVNKNALRAAGGSRGISAVVKPAEVPQDWFSQKRKSAASKLSKLRKQAFDKDAPETVSKYTEAEISGKETITIIDGGSQMELTKEQLEKQIADAVAAAVKELSQPPEEGAEGDNKVTVSNIADLLELGNVTDDVKNAVIEQVQAYYKELQKQAQDEAIVYMANLRHEASIREFSNNVTGGTEDIPYGLPVDCIIPCFYL
jgi:hypothetical protein